MFAVATAAGAAISAAARTGPSCGAGANAGRQVLDRIHGLGLDVAAINNDVGTVAKDAIDGHIDKCGTRSEDVGVGGYLANVVGDQTVVVDSVGAVQLESVLTHAHGVSGPTWAYDHDLG